MAKITVEEIQKGRYFPLQGKESDEEYFRFCTSLASKEGLWLEFGVFQGTSIRMMAELNPDKKIFGFDSFEGLPEGWCGHPKGTFSNNGEIPLFTIGDIEFIKGWFDTTLPEFLKDHQEPVTFLHIDCDLYSSTKTVFDCLEKRIQSGTIILFDEFYNGSDFQEHEMRAFQEFIDRTGIKYEWIAYRGNPCALRII